MGAIGQLMPSSLTSASEHFCMEASTGAMMNFLEKSDWTFRIALLHSRIDLMTWNQFPHYLVLGLVHALWCGHLLKLHTCEVDRHFPCSGIFLNTHPSQCIGSERKLQRLAHLPHVRRPLHYSIETLFSYNVSILLQYV